MIVVDYYYTSANISVQTIVSISYRFILLITRYQIVKLEKADLQFSQDVFSRFCNSMTVKENLQIYEFVSCTVNALFCIVDNCVNINDGTP